MSQAVEDCEKNLIWHIKEDCVLVCVVFLYISEELDSFSKIVCNGILIAYLFIHHKLVAQLSFEVACLRLALQRATRLCIWLYHLALANARWKPSPKRHYDVDLLRVEKVQKPQCLSCRAVMNHEVLSVQRPQNVSSMREIRTQSHERSVYAAPTVWNLISTRVDQKKDEF